MKNKIIFVTGGQMCGKTGFAQELALKLTDKPIYLATSRVWDENHAQRIQNHIQNRGTVWETVEEEKELSKHDFTDKVVLIDCVTLWMTNFFFDNDQNIKKSVKEAKVELDKLFKTEATFIIVSNEVGFGGADGDKMSFKFTDMMGIMNQYIANKSDEAFIVISGISLKIKG